MRWPRKRYTSMPRLVVGACPHRLQVFQSLFFANAGRLAGPSKAAQAGPPRPDVTGARRVNTNPNIPKWKCPHQRGCFALVGAFNSARRSAAHRMQRHSPSKCPTPHVRLKGRAIDVGREGSQARPANRACGQQVRHAAPRQVAAISLIRDPGTYGVPITTCPNRCGGPPTLCHAASQSPEPRHAVFLFPPLAGIPI